MKTPLTTAAITATLAAVTIASAVPSSPPEKVVIKCATVAPDGSTWMNTLEKMNKDIFRRTRGRVSFKFFASGIAGEEKTVLEKMRYDQLQAGGFTGVGLGQVVPATRIVELPFFFENYEEYDYVMSRLAPEFEKRFEEKGFVILGWGEGGFAHLFSKKRIDTLDSLRESKCWLRSDDVVNEVALKELGVSPIPLALSDVLTSIQTGLIETVYVSPLAGIALQWHPHVRYAVDAPLSNILAALVVQKETFDRISPEDQEVVREICQKHLTKLVDLTRRDNAEAVQVLKGKGVEFLKPSAADRADYEKARDRIAKALTGRMWDEALFRRFQSLLAEARSEQAAAPPGK